MDFHREKLVHALEQVKVGLASKDIVVQATKFIFKDKHVFTFNDEVAVSFPIEHDITCAVDANTLYALLTKFTDATISIEITDAGMEVSSKKAHAILKSNDITLPLDSITEADVWHPIPDRFEHLLSFVRLSVGTDLAKPILTCMHWTSEFIESCDNFRLTRTTVKTEGLDASILIPGSSITKMLKYTPIEFSIVDGWAHFKSPSDCIFSCRVFSGEYVELDDIYDTKGQEKIIFTPAMEKLLERAMVLAEQDVSGNSKAVVTIKDGVATVEVVSDAGSLTETTKIRCNIDISFDLRIETLLHIIKYYKQAVIAENESCLKFSKDNIVHIISLL